MDKVQRFQSSFEDAFTRRTGRASAAQRRRPKVLDPRLLLSSTHIRVRFYITSDCT